MEKNQAVAIPVEEDSSEKRIINIQVACDEVLASVEDHRENGGAQADVRMKAINLIELLFADLET